MTKSCAVPKALVWERIPARQSKWRQCGGRSASRSREFEENLGNNLYKLWNRMGVGKLFPAAGESRPDPKEEWGRPDLGRAHGADRVAQTVVKLVLEPVLEPVFDRDSFGYRPGRSALDAVALVRRRSWDYDWVVEFDIKGLFDNIDHELLMRAVRKHCTTPWVLLYVERWLTAPMETADGKRVARERGTPQGGVVSPVLANLFLHYAFDAWMRRKMPSVRFCRYADDAVIHCKSEAQAQLVLRKLATRLQRVRARVAPGQNEDRVLPGHQSAGHVPHGPVHVSWLYVSPAQGGRQVWSRRTERPARLGSA